MEIKMRCERCGYYYPIDQLSFVDWGAWGFPEWNEILCPSCADALEAEQRENKRSVPDFLPITSRAAIRYLTKRLYTILPAEFDDGYITHQIRIDMEKVGVEKAFHYVTNFSPSKLGRLGLLGLRKLAQIKRDRPDVFEKILSDWGVAVPEPASPEEGEE